jgi:hypothetical protein
MYIEKAATELTTFLYFFVVVILGLQISLPPLAIPIFLPFCSSYHLLFECLSKLLLRINFVGNVTLNIYVSFLPNEVNSLAFCFYYIAWLFF